MEYLFEDWTDYDLNDILVSLYVATNDIIDVEIRLEDRKALDPKIDFIPEIGLAFFLLAAAMAVTIILIRCGNNHFSGNLEGSVA